MINIQSTFLLGKLLSEELNKSYKNKCHVSKLTGEPNCWIYTEDKIRTKVHTEVLLQTQFMRTIFQPFSSDCSCGSKNEDYHLFLEGVKITNLRPILDFLYTGFINAPEESIEEIKTLLTQVFGFPEDLPLSKYPPDTIIASCELCCEELPAQNYYKHLWTHMTDNLEEIKMDIKRGVFKGGSCIVCSEDLPFSSKSKSGSFSSILKHYECHRNGFRGQIKDKYSIDPLDEMNHSLLENEELDMDDSEDDAQFDDIRKQKDALLREANATLGDFTTSGESLDENDTMVTLKRSLSKSDQTSSWERLPIAQLKKKTKKRKTFAKLVENSSDGSQLALSSAPTSGANFIPDSSSDEDEDSSLCAICSTKVRLTSRDHHSLSHFPEILIKEETELRTNGKIDCPFCSITFVNFFKFRSHVLSLHDVLNAFLKKNNKCMEDLYLPSGQKYGPNSIQTDTHE